jgi:hypothetical protein
MKLNPMKAAAATALLSLASVAAMAQTFPTVPSQPPTIPTAGLNASSNTESPLLLAVWDPVAGSSLVQWLGLNHGQITIPNMTPDSGGVLNFGTISQYSTVFAQAIGANAVNRLVYAVFSADSDGNLADPNGRVLRTTGTGFQDPLSPVDAFQVDGAVSQYARYITEVINFNDVSPIACARANPCTIINNESSRIFFGGTLVGSGLGGALPAASSIAAVVGTASSFWELATVEDLTATVTQYANAGRVAQWLLTADGVLTYSIAPIPLPAAAWLLLSGLLGFSVVGRRKAGAAATA